MRTNTLPLAAMRGIACFAILREQPIHAVTLTLLLEALAEHCGRDLLAAEGHRARCESPDRPAVIHGVQHAVPSARLARALALGGPAQPTSCLLCRHIPRAWVELCWRRWRPRSARWRRAGAS